MKKKLLQALIYFALTIVTFSGVTAVNDVKCWTQYNKNPEGTNDYDLYSYKLFLDNGMMTEEEVFNEIAYYNYLTAQGVQDLINAGYLHSYIDDLIAVGRLPQGFTPTPTTTETESSTISNNTEIATSNQKEETKPTCDDTVNGTYVVIKAETIGYSEANVNSSKSNTFLLKDEVDVKGLMSNGYYKVLYNETTLYIKENNLVRKDLYDAAWEETNRIESTCQEEGNVTYTNSYTDETQTVVLEKLEHKFETIEKEAQTCTEDGYEKKVCSMCQTEVEETLTKLGHSEGEFETIRKASLFIDGKMESRCLTCDEIIATKNIPAKVPIVAVVVVLLFASGIGVGVYLYKRKEV